MILSSSQLITVKGIAPINNGAIAISRGTILAVGPAKKLLKFILGTALSVVIRLDKAVLILGLVNVHTHFELSSLLDIVRAKTSPDLILNLIKKITQFGRLCYCRNSEHQDTYTYTYRDNDGL